MIDIFIAPFLLIAILVIIHSFFGLEIIKRGVVFTDLAIGQFVAVGLVLSLSFFDGDNSFFISLAISLLVSFLILFVTKKVEHKEAFIGLLYALGLSLMFILLSTTSFGVEEINKLLASDILFVTMSDFYDVLPTYIFVLIVIYFILNRIYGLFGEIIFFSLFALVLTTSVKVIGAVVVFSILVAPALISLSTKCEYKWFLSSILGVLFALIGMLVSYYYDLPTGYTIVMFETLFAIIYLIFKNLKLSSNK